jgi:hypothetical protein
MTMGWRTPPVVLLDATLPETGRDRCCTVASHTPRSTYAHSPLRITGSLRPSAAKPSMSTSFEPIIQSM